MAVASLGKVVVYKPLGTVNTPRQGSKVDTTNSHAGIITKIEDGNRVSLTVFLDQAQAIFVQGVKNDDTGVAGHSWMYPA